MRPRPRGRSEARTRGAGSKPARARVDLAEVIAVTALALVLAGSALLVDPGAESSFDAPKRLVSLVGIVVAAAALTVFPRGDSLPAWFWRAGTREQRVALVLVVIALAGATVSAFLSPRRAISLDTLRIILLFSLLLPIGASRALEGRRAWILVWTFLGACAVNAIVSTLQSAGALEPFRGALVAGRVGTGGFVGNDGYLALLLALGAVMCLAVVLSASHPVLRLAGGAGFLLYAWGLVVNQNLTALIVLITGSIVLVAMLLDRRAVIGTAMVIVVLGGSLMVHPALSARAREALGAVRAGEWDRLLSYRLGPWAAAAEMARARPLVGWGPGTFGAEFVSHRLAAELRFRRRFVNPFLAGSYTEAHSDYLQALAEAGIPATLAVLGAATALLAGLMRVVQSGGDEASRREAIVLLALLLAGGAAALTWFPAQRPISAVPLLLAAGRAWRVSGLRAIGDAP